MIEDKSRHKRKSRESIMRVVRSYGRKKMNIDSPRHATSDQSDMSNRSQSTSSIDETDDVTDSYPIIHMKSMLSLLQQTCCARCSTLWDEYVLGLAHHYYFLIPITQ